jgi:DNA segregation ATPase FtsK/SpoIIIE-like protein
LKYELELEPFQPALAQVGPSVIRFRARPLGRQSLDGVARRAADLGREIGTAEGVLVGQEPYYITVDVPRREREVIRFRDYTHLLGEPEPGALKFLVGMAASGEVTVADLSRLPHLLIAGATGSGKSVFLRSLMCSLLEQHGALDLSILLVDPKQLDFLPFEDLPHLVDGRIIFDPGEAVSALGALIDREIDIRRPLLKRAGASNIHEYYDAGGSPRELQQIVIVVDEFADLASTLGRGERAEFMSLIQRYGQITRAYGIYLVLATQRPSVQVITGDIKANLTARVALKVQASQDSVTILGHGGAESLRDKGDLLFEHGGASERLQGFMVTPQDVAEAVGKWSRL